MQQVRTVYHLMVPVALALLTPFTAGLAYAQGTALPPIKVDLPPSPNFNVQNAPEQYPSGELSVYGLRKRMAKYLDKDVQVKAYLLQIYECPAELRKCNDELAAKSKKEKKKEMKAQGRRRQGRASGSAAPAMAGAAPATSHTSTPRHATTKLDHGPLVADYPSRTEHGRRRRSSPGG